MSERDLERKIIKQAGTIANAISRGKDVEIRKTVGGISVCEISKKVVAK